MRCYEQEVEAPRPGCKCRECYRARESFIDRELLDLVARGRLAPWKISRSAHVINMALTHYLRGDLEYPLLHITIIKALAEACDSAAQAAVDISMRSPLSPIHVPATPEMLARIKNGPV